ncbi:MAG: transcription-repair coupling factor [Deltaproteobacteria bacterium]
MAKIKKWLGQESGRAEVIGLTDSVSAYFLSEVLAEVHGPSLIILPERKSAQSFYGMLEFFTGSSAKENAPSQVRLYQFFPYDISPLSGLSPHPERVSQRIRALYALLNDKAAAVVTSVETICFGIIPKDAFVNAMEYFEIGEEVDRGQLLDTLETTGYQRTSLVEEQGDYSVRGGVIDLFSPLDRLPIRMEFWGDHLESIRQFNPETQRSQREMESFVLLPAAEILLKPENTGRARSMGRLPSQSQQGIITAFPGQEAWLEHFYPHLDSLLAYLPQNGLIASFDSHRWKAQVEKAHRKFVADQEKFKEESAEKGDPFPHLENLPISVDEMDHHLNRHQRLEFSQLGLADQTNLDMMMTMEGPFHLEGDITFSLANRGTLSLAPLAEQIESWRQSRFRVVITCRARQQAVRLQEILENYQVPIDGTIEGWETVPRSPGVYLCLGGLSKGFVWRDLGLCILSEDDIFGAKRRIQKKPKRGKDALNWSSLSLLKAGDFVVHEEHGIGRYGGLSTMEVAGRVHDFVVIEYAGNSKLYLPADRVSILQKYAGANDRDPKLDQLGGQAWEIAKRKAGKSIKKIARQLVELYALRKHRKGNAFSPPDPHYRQFEAGFEHEETDDQLRAVEDVLTDLASDEPMDRLICGDVGFGKTEIAVRAAFKVVADGKQVAFLVPTTVLAEQHFETLSSRMAGYGISVGLLSRFKTKAEQLDVIAKVRSGKINILVGTHRILQKDVRFADLGLLIVDEEQRFGVKQKETLKRYRAMVDVLAITATPVPRTLQMSMMGVRDLSVIETPPEDRLAIETYLSRYDAPLIIRAIEAEVARGGQTFFVHNRVQTIDRMAEKLKGLVPGARFAVAHGQMRAKDLEETMFRFLKKEVDVLVCSTIIESGLDIPSANTIIINEVDRMGLAQIYQLRGRVGRAKEKAYAYLLLSRDAVLTKDAEKRLKALMDFSHLGAGLHLAMHDLKIRGGGNILGFAQSGHISAIGYELYLKLIERAVSELKGEVWEDDINPEINVPIPAFLPGDYVMDTDVRLNLYRRLSGLIEKSELEEVIFEISDRFGPPPQEVENLFALMSVRLILKRLKIRKMDVGDHGVILTFSDNGTVDTERLIRTLHQIPKRYRLLPGNRLRIELGKLSLPEDFHKIEASVHFLDFNSNPGPSRGRETSAEK